MRLQGDRPLEPSGGQVSDEVGEGALEIHVNPHSEQELGSLLDTVTALMWRRDRDHQSLDAEVGSAAWPPEMSGREVEIIQLFAEGENAASAAAALHISVHTVRSHSRNARRKLRSATISQAVAVAIMLGLVTPKTPIHVDAEARARSLFFDE